MTTLTVHAIIPIIRNWVLLIIFKNLNYLKLDIKYKIKFFKKVRIYLKKKEDNFVIIFIDNTIVI